MTTDCPKPEQLELLLKGELEHPDHETVDTHVSQCAACKARMDELTGQMQLLDNLLGAFPKGAPQPPQVSPIPEQIGEYEVVSEIGRGGMGAILEVHDPKLRRNMALKLIHGDAAGQGLGDMSQVDLRTQGRFQEEAQITSQLSHPGIVPVFELGRVEDGRPFFTMQLVSGRTLRVIFELVEEESEEWTLPRALGVLLRVCEAMAYAHSQGVVHRDLKPANIMVGEFGEVYVMDWGVARVMDQPDPHDLRLRQELRVSSERQETRELSPDSPLVTADGDIVGTPVYMSPEQAAGMIEELSTRSDVYSVGAMLYRLLTGTVPYIEPGTRPSSHVILFRVQEGPPPPVHELAPDCPIELVAICEKAMAREPDDRYQDMLEMADDLRAFLEQRVVKAYEAGAWATYKKWVLRNRGLAAAISLGILAVFAGLAATALTQKNANYHLQRKSDIYQLTHLRSNAHHLWPAHPEKISELEDWLAAGDSLVSRRNMHEEYAADLDPTDRDSEPEREFLDKLSDFASARGLLEDVRARLAFARTIEERSISSPNAQGLWSQAIASIADLDKCPHYGGFRLKPQLGLLPIGQDPETKLWEFVHLQTGKKPDRDHATGRLIITEDTGIVFVLIPAGTFRMGSTRDESHPGYVSYHLNGSLRHGDTDEFDSDPVTLSPYFLSKYEMSQGQWLRARGENPSAYSPTSSLATSGISWDLTHPVERVKWSMASETMRRLALTLPTEAQWECGARGGKETAWPWGSRPDCLVGHANFADPGLKLNWPAKDNWTTNVTELNLDPELMKFSDEYIYHAPVDTFEPNGFGLYNTAGNVWEWCRDRYVRYDEQPSVRAGDGERSPGTDGANDNRVYRGGSFKHAFYMTRCADRAYDPPDYVDNYMGLRPARAIEN